MKSLLERKIDFINKAKKLYGNQYDYSKVNYAGKNTKVRIYCIKHNTWFFQTPALHLRGSGCSGCAKEKMSVSAAARKVNWNDDSILQKLQELLSLGKSFESIGKVFNISGHQVGVIVRKYKLNCDDNPNVIVEKQQLENLLSKNLTLKQISEIFGVTAPTISNKIKKYNISKPNLLEKNKADKETIMGLVKLGKSLRSISKTVGISLYVLRNFIKDNKIEVPHRNLNNYVPKIKNLAKDGNCLNRISKELGISRAIVLSLAKKHKINITKRNIKFDRDQIENYISEGYSFKEMALLMGITYPETITRFAKREGLVNPNRLVSTGELFVREYLDNHNIPYEQGKFYSSIEGRTICRVFIDFVIENYKGRTYWVEYNGLQHYRNTPRFHKTPEDFDKQLKRDSNIREYCKKNDIVFIEIPYILNSFDTVSNFLDEVLILDRDPDQLINYKELY